MSDNLDVFVTIGNPSSRTLSEHVRYILGNTSAPNTTAKGQGQWDDYKEFSAFLLWTDVSPEEATEIRNVVINSGHEFNQDAVGVLTVPAGTALVPTR